MLPDHHDELNDSFAGGHEQKTPHRLPYAKPRRSIRIRNVAISLLLALCAILAVWHRRMVERSELLLLQHRCASYTEHFETPIYADVSLQDFPTLLQKNPTMQSLDVELPHRAGRLSQEWAKLRRQLRIQQDIIPEATLFVGNLQSPNGDVRLVAVELSMQYTVSSTLIWPGANARPLTFQMDSLRPIGFFTPVEQPVHTIATADFIGDLRQLSQGDFVLFPGSVVPPDRSSFEAKVVVRGFAGILRGTLNNDGSVRLRTEGLGPQ